MIANILERAPYKPVVCKEDNDPRNCKAVEVLAEVVARGAFVHFEDEKGNCHQAALGVLAMIGRAGLGDRDWYFMQGTCESMGWHSWVEYQGWAVDFSNGQQFFAPIDIYYKLRQPKGIKRFTAAKIARMLQSTKSLKKLRMP